jgi:predicted secreted protein
MKTFGETGYDYGYFVQQTSDGGYIIVGSVNLYEPILWDVWLIKIDSNGKEQWNRTFGESQQEDFGESVLQTPDGGYIIAGSTMSYGHDKGYACWVIKTDEQGHEQWNRTYSDMYSWGGARVVEFASDGGYVIFGNKGYYSSSQVDVRCIKINQYGDEQWNKTYGGIKDDHCLDASQTSDEGYIMIGLTNSSGAGGYDVWISKIDAYGNEQWEKTYGGRNDDYGRSIDITTDGGYIITGSKGSNIKDDYSTKIWLIKTDSQGKSKTLSSGNLWFERLIQRFPNVFPLLGQLMGH